MNYGGKINADAQKSIDACIEAYSCCEQTIAHCLQQGKQHVDMTMMGPLMDCVDVARACADMMMRQSPHAVEMSATCARVADMCAEACMTMNSDPVMKRCAGICRTCAEACRSLAGVRA
ncbi:four-helix bundle copper-binding protein [Actinomadura sp. DC4]|uniref:four-helix bundle copper-binding protein n=1 Tax=Actinomadura sp. DC4 TaxID=3055069 RepID=UPI0025B127B2|nr:four-helix bundle copper-binding protein [Actinomadura sp. DC4]MDN3354974.1 four-helix bundle copper-binding protein [Actinomadura sp. DC4]